MMTGLFKACLMILFADWLVLDGQQRDNQRHSIMAGMQQPVATAKAGTQQTPAWRFTGSPGQPGDDDRSLSATAPHYAAAAWPSAETM
jgi:hypothetical protein